MNSFETDLKRAILSGRFAAAVLLEFIILRNAGADSELFRIGVPVLSAFPYSTAWLSDAQSGYLKSYLPRCGLSAYIAGKFFACGISGGLAEAIPCLVGQLLTGEYTMDVRLLFATAAFWACVSAVLAAVSYSSYVAYGGSFVVCYMLVMLQERYFPAWYTLDPYEWISYQHTWMFDEQGILMLLGGMIGILYLSYRAIIRTRVQGARMSV